MARITKRRADRTTFDMKLDETDKEVGRSMLGKKRRKKKVPFYSKNWFTVLALLGLCGVMLVGIYVVFIRPPSANSLYREAEAAFRSDKLQDHKEGREAVGLFLRHYPDEPRADQVRRWRDQADLESTSWYVAHDRRGDTDPKDGWLAVADEKDGRLDEAAKRWKKLLALKDESDPDQHGWGLLAEKSLKDIDAAYALYRDLVRRVQQEKLPKAKPYESKSETEALALDALRSQAAQEPLKAKRLAEDLARRTADGDEYRAYHLLALKIGRDVQ
jgi:hypothetical protein